jgi:hypothetical protein
MCTERAFTTRPEKTARFRSPLAAGATQCSLPHSERDELGLSEDDGPDNQTCVFLRRYTKDKSCWEQNKCRYPPSHFSLPPSEQADFFMCKLTPDRKVMQGGAICGLLLQNRLITSMRSFFAQFVRRCTWKLIHAFADYSSLVG